MFILTDLHLQDFSKKDEKKPIESRQHESLLFYVKTYWKQYYCLPVWTYHVHSEN